MESEDYLMCKKTIYYDRDIYDDKIYDSTTSFIILITVMILLKIISIRNLFRKPIFKKGKKYKIRDVRAFNYRAVTSIYPTIVEIVSDKMYTVFDEDNDISTIPEGILFETFYTQKELRKLKLKKLK